jgi:hypothetical protein
MLKKPKKAILKLRKSKIKSNENIILKIKRFNLNLIFEFKYINLFD